MKRTLLAAVLFAPAAAAAQWQVGGNFGLRARPDGGDGQTVFGTQFEVMAVKAGPRVSHIFSGSSVQMRNHTADGSNIRENGIELGYMYRRAINDAWGAAIGPVLGYSTGCASGGTHSVTYGATHCIESYTAKGTKRPGYNLQLDWQKTTANSVTWRAGARLTGHTVASGSKTPKPVVWAGFTAPLNR